jgi:hypothetical protein
MRLSKERTLIAALTVVLVLALAALALAGCGEDTPTTTAAPTETTTAPTATTAGGGTGSGAGIAVSGMADDPATITVEALEAMGTETLTLEHPKNGPTEYTGVRFSAIVQALVVQATATTVVLTARDGFSADVTLAEIAGSPDSMLTIGEDDTFAAAFPGLSSKAWVKDIVSMEFK